MFNKSIVVALILCACYLSVSQANVLSGLAIPVHGIDAAEQIKKDLTNTAGVGGTGSGVPVVGDVLSGGSRPQLPVLSNVGK
ncbi:uncharacterized protein [Drosophila kikkawai]|uniref:Uncharacterized protein n=1 Tax=Drosophila kikkawai TaxID=30033 RepID=A0ABM4GNU6_DROKI